MDSYLMIFVLFVGRLQNLPLDQESTRKQLLFMVRNSSSAGLRRARSAPQCSGGEEKRRLSLASGLETPQAHKERLKV